ncbi:MAG: terpene cyclase/mutase family protein [Acidobacteria bacterium]|nr:terpene cyclase/mutase family protein [Acidobacteriota bacterium]MBI3657949.1 terpene cyclase/mutase family protein [Acidobacteriota bacterium]
MVKITKYMGRLVRYKPWRADHFRLIMRDIRRPSAQAEQDHEIHLKASIDWLGRAQDVRRRATDSGGVSAGWSFEDGWLPSYPETSGYIVETFIAAAKVLNQPELLHRALSIIDWELSLQNTDGSFPGHFGEPGSAPVIFNTGQIMHGMLAGYIHFGRTECLSAAVRAGQWMMERQDDDGCWRRSEHNGTPHTYNTRAAWALLRTGLLANDASLNRAAVQNLEWAYKQQTESGWFATNAFTRNRAPFTHTIAYAIRGFLESALLLGQERYLHTAEKAAAALANAQRENGWLTGVYDDGWVPAAYYCCLTGVAQMAINWERLSHVHRNRKYSTAIQRALSFLKKNQVISHEGNAVDGGLAGSVPIWGGYSRFEYPNWANKFFSDALMMDMEDIVIPSTTKAGH